MKIIKILLIILFAIVALVLLIALFISKSYKVEKSIVIHASKDSVFNYIKHLKNQNDYSVWSKMDPNWKTSFSGVDGTVGFVSAWESEVKNVGSGSQTITKIVEGDSIVTKLKFIKPFKAENDTYLTVSAVDAANTKVSWAFAGSYPYPMNIMKLIFNLEKMIGKDFEQGLENMKVIIEKK
jgi:hypothetical protein